MSRRGRACCEEEAWAVLVAATEEGMTALWVDAGTGFRVDL